MKKEQNYEGAPKGFAYCFGGDCPQAEHCLRHLASGVIAPERRMVYTLNPACVRKDGSCPEFVSDVPVQVAYGWGELYKKLPVEKAEAIKQELLAHYGKTEYYRRGRQEKPITPQEQRMVTEMFKRHGVTEEPAYERYDEQLLWMREAVSR